MTDTDDPAGVDAFEHAYTPADVLFGRGTVADLGDALGERGIERALVVCGSNVGANDALMDPLREGLGDRFAGVFDGTTPRKSVEDALAGVEAWRDTEADGLVAVGGGSSLDVSKAMRIIAAKPRDRDDLRAEAEEHGRLRLPEGVDPAPAAAVPTTFAGADLSVGGSVSFPAGPNAGLTDRRLMPDVACYDPALFETTPDSVLRGSAMNGFDKGIEMAYASDGSPVTDATAVRGLRYLRRGLPDALDDGAAMERAVTGIVLVQYGLSTPGATKLGPIHAFGHGLSRGYPLQQGVAHAVAAPRVLRDVFETVDGERDLLAEGLEVAADPASIVAAVREVRDALDLPSRLRDVDGPSPGDFDAVARAVHEDHLLPHGPPGYDPDVDDLRDLVETMW
ncbi:MAG: iron-containing alcohol dehydrogenase family protein [Haloferacaceae archaeon]